MSLISIASSRPAGGLTGQATAMADNHQFGWPHRPVPVAVVLEAHTYPVLARLTTPVIYR